MTEANNKELPFDEKAQKAVIGHLFSDIEFALKCNTLLQKECFATEPLAKLYARITAFYQAQNRFASKEEMINEIHIDSRFDSLEKDQCKRLLNDCIAQCTCFNIQYIRGRMTKWLQASEYRKTFDQFAAVYKSQNIDAISDLMQASIRRTRELDFNKDGQYIFGNHLDDIEAMKEDNKGILTTGMPILDQALGGGLRRKEHTVIAAPVNTGKTSLCINIAKANIEAGKNVLFITHEMNPLDVSIKFKQAVTEMTKEEYRFYATNGPSDGLKTITSAEKLLHNHLCYYPYNKAGGIYIEDVIDIVRRKNEERIGLGLKPFDMLIDDYPAKLSSREMKNTKDKRHSLAYIYEQFQQLAIEYNMHCVSPVQINRAGVKKNQERKADDEFITGADVAESHQILQDASNVFVANRSREDEKKNQMYLYIDKSRSSAKNFAIRMDTDFSKCLLIGKNLKQEMIEEGTTRPKEKLSEERVSVTTSLANMRSGK